MRNLLIVVALASLLLCTSCMNWFGDAMDQWFPQRVSGQAEAEGQP
jgi:hypothetical protein